MTPRNASWWSRSSRSTQRVARTQAAVLDELRESLRVEQRTGVARVLRRGVTLLVDGGGRVQAPTEPVRGRGAAAEALIRLLGSTTSSTSTSASVNGMPALVFRTGEQVTAVLAVTARGGRASDVWVVVNPDKLRHWNLP